MDSFIFYINCFLSMGLFLIVIYIVYNSSNSFIESFNDFSPYFDYNSNEYLKYNLYKKVDEKLLKRKLNLWENNDDGYFNADIDGVPLAPIILYNTYKKIE